ncbi:hypothetical protein FQN57_002848 [Myotisia sp. PD_48]|nr:hypothetical protein FQN57_002848 [Myotisia sp. PD_48]
MPQRIAITTPSQVTCPFPALDSCDKILPASENTWRRRVSDMWDDDIAECQPSESSTSRNSPVMPDHELTPAQHLFLLHTPYSSSLRLQKSDHQFLMSVLKAAWDTWDAQQSQVLDIITVIGSRLRRYKMPLDQ